MRKLVSFADGDALAWQNVTLPFLQVWAEHFGWELQARSLASASEHYAPVAESLRLSRPLVRPASWYKLVEMMIQLKRPDVEQVLWVDADVIPQLKGGDIGDELGGQWHALSPFTQCGVIHYNCGVWLVTPAMLPYLRQAWDKRHCVEHPWWEQAAMMELLGFVQPFCRETSPAHPSELFDHTRHLPRSYNWCPHDEQIHADCFFAHAAGMHPHRLAVLEHWAECLRRGKPLDRGEAIRIAAGQAAATR